MEKTKDYEPHLHYIKVTELLAPYDYFDDLGLRRDAVAREDALAKFNDVIRIATASAQSYVNDGMPADEAAFTVVDELEALEPDFYCEAIQALDVIGIDVEIDYGIAQMVDLILSKLVVRV